MPLGRQLALQRRSIAKPRLEFLEDRMALASFQGLGFLPGASYSEANAVSADGLVVVGASTYASGDAQAFRWTAAGGMVGLG